MATAEQAAQDVLAVQRILDSGVAHCEVSTWERVRDERLAALMSAVVEDPDPSDVMRAAARIEAGVDAGRMRVPADVVRAVRELMGAQGAVGPEMAGVSPRAVSAHHPAQ